MIDTDGSGAVDALELKAVFTVRKDHSPCDLSATACFPLTPPPLVNDIDGTSQPLPAFWRRRASYEAVGSFRMDGPYRCQLLHQGCAGSTVRAFSHLVACLHPASREPWLCTT